MPFATGVLSGHGDLAAAAQLLHDLCFDRIELQTPKLSYEPRWSCQCRECAAVWVASKSGDVMRIDLETLSGRPGQTWFPGNREARTIYHQHDGLALGGTSFLLIGRDDGALDIISEQHEDWTGQQPAQRHHGSPSSFYLDAWWACADERNVGAGFPRTAYDGAKYTTGVTAVSVVARAGDPDTLDILVATRRPALYVIEATHGVMRIRHRIAMPGWIQWYELDDAEMTERRTQLFDRLARMWDVEDHDQLEGNVKAFLLRAFELGCNAIAITRDQRRGWVRDIAAPEPATPADPLQVPRLHVRTGVNASNVCFVSRTPR
jgi:hypothetical protein